MSRSKLSSSGDFRILALVSAGFGWDKGLDPHVRAEKAAAADHRSLTSLIEKLLADYCRKEGFLK
jgi:hypothetical protein